MCAVSWNRQSGTSPGAFHTEGESSFFPQLFISSNNGDSASIEGLPPNTIVFLYPKYRLFNENIKKFKIYFIFIIILFK